MANSLLPQPRNPARMPAGVENFLAAATTEPLWDVAKGVGALATGQGLGAPEVGAGIMGAMGLLSPMKAGAIKPVAQGIRAYHGSPYKFDRFSMDKIGTGEGAQSYGHGLYFAENEGVARAYRDSVTGSSDSALGSAKYLLRMNKGDYDAALAELRSRPARVPDAIAFDKEVEKHLLNRSVSPGHMYEVNINARPEQFLDWDRPLSGQSEAVQKAVPPLKVNTREIGFNPNIGETLYDVVASGGGTLGAFPKSKVDEVLANPTKFDPRSGEMVYRGLERHYGRGSLTAGKPDASDVLREAGIPGIKYLDQGSRSAGEGSRNYVVFDDKLIDILKRYGIAGMGLSGLIAANQGDFGYRPKAPLNDTVSAAAYQ